MTTNNNSINISRDNVSGNCDLKCAYNFKYPNTNVTAKNDDVMISFTCDKNNTLPVLYNNYKYDVDKFIIVAPSIHKFNNSKASAEILINHTPAGGGKQLIVCIPIIESTDSSKASNLIAQLIQGVSSGAPAQGETTNLNINEFTLNDIVPKKPFYTYTNNNNGKEYIVYDILYAITINNSNLTTLKKIIKPYPIPTLGDKLYYNKKGPNEVKVGDGIYISCQPTGSSKEKIDVEYSKNESSYDTFNFDKKSTKIFLAILFACIGFAILFKLVIYFYSLIPNDLKKPVPMKNV